jgi:hypothetical protein
MLSAVVFTHCMFDTNATFMPVCLLLPHSLQTRCGCDVSCRVYRVYCLLNGLRHFAVEKFIKVYLNTTSSDFVQLRFALLINQVHDIKCLDDISHL